MCSKGIWPIFFIMLFSLIVKNIVLSVLVYVYEIPDSGFFSLKTLIGFIIFALIYIPLWWMFNKREERKLRVKRVI